MKNFVRMLMVGVLTTLSFAPPQVSASTLRVSAGFSTRSASETEADYGMWHVFVDEVKGETVPITIFFDPQTTGVESAEVFTNLNRREKAAQDANNDGIEDGILPPDGNGITAGDDKNYFKAYPMQLVQGGYQITLQAQKCGAYRLTVRYRLQGDSAGKYRWYDDERNAQGIRKRDFAIVISPPDARNWQIYEVNPLTILATGTGATQRGTLADLAQGLPGNAGPRFSLNYLKSLGCNTIWLQPIHPRGIEGRQTNPATNQPYVLGSPYAVKNFFAVSPLLAKAFVPGPTPDSQDTPAGRAEALKEFQAFMQAADQAGVNVILDAPFNHTARDVELSSNGLAFCNGAQGCGETTEIRNVEARFFSRSDEYDLRAFNAGSIAIAPDRYDFPKWTDVLDVYFGRYAALVNNASQSQSYLNEEDWFDYSIGDENSTGPGNGHFDTITQRVWHYFGDYLQYWLTATGYPANTTGASLNSTAGIDGLRADFGQGLPAPGMEYIVNRTRSRKWNFVFMAESLDGGPVTYRSARHFDVLNEKIIYDLHHAVTTSQFRDAFDSRRNSYGAALVLLNTSSHDEDTYKDPFQAFLRFAINNTMAGATLISPGQELGETGTIIPPNDSSASFQAFGYDRFDEPFFGKPIPDFKDYNSMMPLWAQLANGTGLAKQFLALYSGVGQSRSASVALRSANREYLNLMDGSTDEQIFSVAKFQERNADPKSSDVVFAFVSLDPSTSVQTPSGNFFNVNVDADQDGKNDFGISPNRLYNVKNIAAYTASDATRNNQFLWSTPRSGSDLLQNGIFVSFHSAPGSQDGWNTNPYEAQFLKLVDVTP